VNACTQGIWIWSEVIKTQLNGKPINVLIADTEGLASNEATDNHD